MKRFSLKNTIVAVSISAVLLTGTSFSAAPTPRHPRQLSFAERVAYQYAIEEVYWRHRIWPKENPSSKPLLDEVMSAAQIEKKVEDYLRNSQLLADQWQRPLAPDQLQAEMERMATQTKQPEVLQELFAALDNDPFLIAECLARSVLSERLAKQLYGCDERIHGELKRRAELELLACQSVEQMKQTSGTYSEIEWIRRDDQSSSAEIDNGTIGHAHRLPIQDSAAPKAFGAALKRHDAPNAIHMTNSDWDERVERLAAQFSSTVIGRARPQVARRGEGAPLPKQRGDAVESITAGLLGGLQEDDAHFSAAAVVGKEKDRLKLATVSWSKEPFESWAANVDLLGSADEPAADYTLPKIGSSAMANPSTSCMDNAWTPTFRPYLPSARQDHTTVWTGSEMIVWGGDYANTGWKYNPSTEIWIAITTTNAPVGRVDHTAVWTGNEMIVWGGYGSSELNTGGKYNPITDTWVATTLTNAPTGRRYYTAIWTGSEMIVWGGRNCTTLPCEDFNTGGRFNPSTNSWTATTTVNAPDGRSGQSAVWTGSEMIIWGGGGGPLNTGGRYNPSTNSWVATAAPGNLAGRNSHKAVWTGSEMIVWGGSDCCSFVNTGARYSPSTNSWLATSTTNAPAQRTRNTAIWTGSEMIIWGGSIGGYTNTGGRYRPSTDSWVATTTANAPDGRDSHTSIWTGSEMIIWGGYGDNDDLNSGGKYNPSTDSWVATNANAPPDPNAHHTAVWTGSEMIVWGGYANGYQKAGRKYNPVTDNWIPMNRINAPAGRESHTAIWTGNEMIVWGGYGEGDDLNTGGRYNPTTDGWVATSLTNAPAQREDHTAVWTGIEMIVWGGFSGGGGDLNTGGKYSPVANSWVPTTTTNAATARERHTAVWTGSEMIVWGGFSGDNTGGRYNPSSDSWVATNIANSPAARAYHSAVWTGGEMIIWGGGAGPGNIFNTGGRYNPITDSWVTTTTTNAPSARYVHTAVWTGGEMIIWGGTLNGSNALNTGSRYRPSTDSWIATNAANAPSGRYAQTAVWTGSEMIVWGGWDGVSSVNTGGRYCVPSAAPVAQSAVSRKVHGLSGTFNVDLPLTGTAGIECRTGGATNDYSMVVTFASAVTVNGSPQAQVTSGTATVGSSGVSNGGMVTISGNSVTIPLTNVANAQTINVRLNAVTGSSGSGNITIPMSILVGDTNANAAVNSGDVAQTKARLGQTLDATNFRSDVNANGAINAGDVSQIKSLLGTGLP